MDPVGMCGIYTAIPDPSVANEVSGVADDDGSARGWHRNCFGRHNMMQLAAAVMPASHRSIVQRLVDRGAWGMFTPGTAHAQEPNPMLRLYDLPPVAPLWPDTIELTCIVGGPPAVCIPPFAALLTREIVRDGVAAFERRDLTASEVDPRLVDPRLVDPRLLLEDLCTFLRAARDREDAVVIHWEYR